MKAIKAFIAVAIVGAGQAAFAACGVGTLLDQAGLSAAFAGKTVCGVPGVNYPGNKAVDKWAEFHQGSGTGGTLIEMHEGGSSQENMGGWNISDAGGGVGTITYTYTGGTNFTYYVYSQGVVGPAGPTPPFSFCDSVGPSAQEIVTSTLVQAGGVACP